MVKILGSLVISILLVISFAWASSNGTSDMAVGPVAITDGDGYTPPSEIDMTWTVGTNQPTARYGAVSGWYNGEVYFTHGRISNAVPYNTALCEKFDPTPLPGVWTTLTPAPTARRMVGAGKVQSENYIHSVGGRFDAVTTVGTYERYDMSSDTWVTLPPCMPRWAHGAAALPGGIVYVFGGDNAGVNLTVQRYDPAPINAWTAAGVVPNLPAARGWCAGAALNGKIYCIGGSGANTLYEYTPGAAAWVVMAPLPANRFYHWAVADESVDKIKVFGGATVTAPTADVLVWDQATNVWSTETAMPGARSWPCVGGDNTQTFFVMGGFDGSAMYYNQSWIGEEGTVTPPNMTITMTYTSGSPVPAGGGPLAYTVVVQNNETTPQPFQYWTTYSQGTTVVPAFGPASRICAASWTITRYLTQMVPGSLTPGAWNYNGNIGVYPATVWDTDFFPFTKLATGDGGAYISEGTLYGWEEEDPEVVAATPKEFELLGNYPNPFNPTTTISYSLGNDDFVSLSVYDLSGRKVATLVNGWREAGSHTMSFDASGLPSGVYVYRLTAGASSASAKMVLMK